MKWLSPDFLYPEINRSIQMQNPWPRRRPVHTPQDEDIADAHRRAEKADDDDESVREDVSHNTQDWLDHISGQ